MNLKRKLISIIFIFALVFTSVTTTVSVSSAATDSEYWLKVNTKANVVTAYKKIDGKWVAYRAMRCSTGINNGKWDTPSGSYKLKSRWDWGAMMDDVYARYCTHITGDYLFHSVPYYTRYNKKSQSTWDFNRLGNDASHGCIRLSLMDAKWIYENCPKGTNVTIYASSNPGPLGKPPAIQSVDYPYQYWDPTDPDPANPIYRLKKPVIKVSSSKKTVIQYGSSYNLKSGVTAKDPNTYQSLTPLVTVSKVQRWDKNKKAYVNTTFSTSKYGYYKVTYRVKDKYSGTSTKTIKLQVSNILKTPKVTAGNRASDGKPKLTWAPVKNASKYEVYRATSRNGKYTKMCTTSGTSYVNLANVEVGKCYYYKVKAIGSRNVDVDSSFSPVVYRTCDLPQPKVTTSINKATGKPKLTWTAVSGASKYEVYRSTSKNGKYYKTYTTTGRSYINTSNSVPGVQYYYKVRAVSKKTSAANSAYTLVTRVCAYPQPKVTIALQSTDGMPKLSWKSVGTGTYEIYRSTKKDSGYTKLASTDTTIYTDTTAKSNTTYYYKVRIRSKSNTSVMSYFSEAKSIKTGKTGL